ncbi:TetR/AcrR family transcriptional regulator, partial [Mesorhizobium sp. M7A.F.Ca.US.006.01.2.1]
DIYYRLFLAEPVMRDIWSGTQADKALRQLELADSRANAEFLTAVLKRLRPAADPVALETTAFLIWQMGEAAMRLAISVERQEGDRLVAAYKRMALRELLAE